MYFCRYVYEQETFNEWRTMADKLIEHATNATNNRLSGSTRRSEFMNSLTSIELEFLKGAYRGCEPAREN